MTRTQILSVASTLFAQQGYEQTSIDEIAKKADIAKGTFYYHFDSKEEVVIALRHDSFIDSIRSALDALNNGASPIGIMEQVFLERAAWTEKNPDLAKVFFEQRIHQFLFRENDVFVFPGANSHLHKETDTNELVNQSKSDKKINLGSSNGKTNTTERMRLFHLIHELIIAAQAKKELRKDIDASEMAQIIIAIFIHAQGSWLGGYSGISLIDKVHRWFHAILDGLYDQSFRTK